MCVCLCKIGILSYHRSEELAEKKAFSRQKNWQMQQENGKGVDVLVLRLFKEPVWVLGYMGLERRLTSEDTMQTERR